MSAPSDLRDVETADVYKGDLLAGRLTRHGDNIEFTYDTSYLSDASSPDVAWSIPKTMVETSATSGSVPPFFAGLLPEGIRLTGVVTSTKTSADDHLTILLAVGSDTIGDVRVVPQGAELPTASTAFDSSQPVPDLRALFASLSSTSSMDLDSAALPGVQGKVSAQMYSTPISTATGPAILKLAPPLQFPRLVENENFFMSLAPKSGLRVPAHRIVSDRNSVTGLLVERFDRRGGVRLAQEDSCQVADVYPASKYRLKSESVIALLADAVERGGGSARQATAELVRLTAYSYAIGNGDLHGKNHSIHQDEPGIWSITPAYDLLSTQPYASWNDPMALNFYGRANRWTRSFLVESALRLGLPERATHRILDDVCSGVREAIGDVGAIGFDEKTTRRLAKSLEKRCEDLS